MFLACLTLSVQVPISSRAAWSNFSRSFYARDQVASLLPVETIFLCEVTNFIILLFGDAAAVGLTDFIFVIGRRLSVPRNNVIGIPTGGRERLT